MKEEVIRDFLTVPGIAGIALIDGVSRHCFHGLGASFTDAQQVCIAQGIQQVLETTPEDFNSFEFQFDAYRIYLNKLKQGITLLVLTNNASHQSVYTQAIRRLLLELQFDHGDPIAAFRAVAVDMPLVWQSPLPSPPPLPPPSPPPLPSPLPLPSPPPSPPPVNHFNSQPRRDALKTKAQQTKAQQTKAQQTTEQWATAQQAPQTQLQIQTELQPHLPAEVSEVSVAASQSPTPAAAPNSLPASSPPPSPTSDHAIPPVPLPPAIRLAASPLESSVTSPSVTSPSVTSPNATGLPRVTTVSVTPPVNLKDVLAAINALSQLSTQYLGTMVVANYWQATRPSIDWLNHFQVERSTQMTFLVQMPSQRLPVLTVEQHQWLQSWVAAFVERCSRVIRDFAKLAHQTLTEQQRSLLFDPPRSAV